MGICVDGLLEKFAYEMTKKDALIEEMKKDAEDLRALVSDLEIKLAARTDDCDCECE
jgi:hypothetical protein